MPKYIRLKERYCGILSVQNFSLIASCISLAFQLTFSIFFLLYGSLWGLVPLIITIISHSVFIFSILRFKSTGVIYVFLIVEIIYAFSILGIAIWVLSWILDPTYSFLYLFCVYKLKYPRCYSDVQILSLIWGFLFILFFFANIFLLPVYKTAIRNIKIKNDPSKIAFEGHGCSTQGLGTQPIFNINPVPQNPAHPQILVPHLIQQNSQNHALQMQIYTIPIPQNNVQSSFIEPTNHTNPENQSLIERI